MPMIISPSQAAIAIGAKCGGSAPMDTDPELVNILTNLTPRIVAALNVETLDQGNYIDRFFLDHDKFGTPQLFGQSDYQVGRHGPRKRVRLSNAFIDTGSVSMLDEDDNVFDIRELGIDGKYGTLELEGAMKRGYYAVSYTSGFAVDSNNVYQGIPAFLPPILDALLVLWYRTTYLVVKTPKEREARYVAVMNALQREIHSRIYTAYQRPRMSVIWAESRF